MGCCPSLVSVSFLCLLLCCSSATEVVTIDVHAAKELTNSGYRYLDVRWINRFSLWIGLSLKFLGWVLFWLWNLNWIHRTVEEFKKGHADVENILNIPYLFTTPEGTYIISGSVCWFVWDINISCTGSRTSAKMIWMWVWVSERLKIPEFLEQVQSACSKEDHLVVVIFHLISGLNHNKYNLDEFSEIVYLFSMNGCLGGVRSLAAASVLVNAVTSSSTFFSFLFCFWIIFFLEKRCIENLGWQGFKDVKDMGGGYEAWVETGLTVTKPKEEEKWLDASL